MPEDKKPENPFAFPLALTNEHNYIYDGMTLRDYFASKAMQGYMSTEHSGWSTPEAHAISSYEIADAMLKAREL